jgi:hypothetical protein
MVLEIPEKKTYVERNRRSVVVITVFSGAIFLLCWLSSALYLAILVSIFFFVVQSYRAVNRNRFFITGLKISGQHVSIVYKDGRNEKDFNGELAHMLFRKRRLFSRTRDVCLKIFNNGELVLRQCEIDDWNEPKFDAIIKAVKNAVSITVD